MAIFAILDFCDFLSKFGHCNSTCDTFSESLGPWEYNRTVFKIFVINKDKEEGLECLLTVCSGILGIFMEVFTL